MKLRCSIAIFMVDFFNSPDMKYSKTTKQLGFPPRLSISVLTLDTQHMFDVLHVRTSFDYSWLCIRVQNTPCKYIIIYVHISHQIPILNELIPNMISNQNQQPVIFGQYWLYTH